jgi:hypothetical protein
MTLSARLIGGLLAPIELAVGPIWQWPLLFVPILLLTAGTIALAIHNGAGGRQLLLIAVSPFGWVTTMAAGALAACDRSVSNRCPLADLASPLILILPLAGLGYGVFLIAHLKGMRCAPCAVFIVNLAYTALAMLGASEAASGVSL